MKYKGKLHCLRFPLKREWFEKIKNGEKTVEYREVKPYWDKRIRNLYYFNNLPESNQCIFSLGYTKEKLIADIKTIQIMSGKKNDLQTSKNVYAIHFENVRAYFEV